MLGASHMRYNFNYIISLLYGEDKVPDARKYKEEHIETSTGKNYKKWQRNPYMVKIISIKVMLNIIQKMVYEKVN